MTDGCNMGVKQLSVYLNKYPTADKSAKNIAEKLIRDIGKEPYKDIKIEFTGLRQGDKLHEKLFYDFELPQKTQCDKILRVNGSAIAGLTSEIKKLYRMAAENDRGGITELMMKITDKDLIGRI